MMTPHRIIVSDHIGGENNDWAFKWDGTKSRQATKTARFSGPGGQGDHTFSRDISSKIATVQRRAGRRGPTPATQVERIFGKSKTDVKFVVVSYLYG